MRIFLLLISLFLLPNAVYLQDAGFLDSLERELENSRNKKDSVKILDDLAWFSRNSHPEEALEYAHKQLVLAKQLEEPRWTGRAYNNLGIICYQKRNYDKALGYYKRSLDARLKEGDQKAISSCYNNIALVYEDMGQYPKALEYHIKALKVNRDIGYEGGIASTYNNLGNIYRQQGDYRKAQENYLKSLRIKDRLNDREGLSVTYNNMALLFTHQKRYQKALGYYQKGLEIDKEGNNRLGIAISNNNIGMVYQKMGKNSKALEHYEMALEDLKDLGLKDGLADIYSNMGTIYQGMEDKKEAIRFLKLALETDRKTGNLLGEAKSLNHLGSFYLQEDAPYMAKKYFEKGLNLSGKIGTKPMEVELYKNLSSVYEQIHRYKKALQYQRQYSKLKNELMDSAKAEALADAEMKYETRKKEKEIQLLKKKNELEQAKVKRQEIVIGFVIIGLVILLILSLVLYRLYIKKQEALKLQEEQKDEIQFKNWQLEKQKEEIKSQKRNIVDQNFSLSQKNEDLKDLNEEKDQIIGILAHDLRGPLSHISGLVDILKLDNGNMSEEQKESLYHLEHSVWQVDELIRKLLDINRIKARGIRAKLQPASIKKIMENVIGGYRDIAGRKDINFDIQWEEKDYRGKVDVLLARQVFENLLSNAVKFSPPGSRIEIKMKKESDYICTEIIDEGPGLRKEDFGKLFRKFQKLSAKPTWGEPSTGLGLSIVKKFVDCLKGQVSVENAPSKGAWATVRFPVEKRSTSKKKKVSA